MSDWDPALYLRYADERTRPARELVQRLLHPAPLTITDLGCGPGNSTELLVERWPEASITGLDTSQAMLDKAKIRLPDCRFVKDDISTWQPETPQDIIYANAALQWVPDHMPLFPALVDRLAPGGLLAIQMPDNLDEPSHQLMRQVAADGPWASKIGDPAAKRPRLLSTESYYDLFSGSGCEVDIWRTTYYHVMADPAAIVDWVRATGLRPFLNPLTPAEQTAFLQQYQALLGKAYPQRQDGQCLLAFPRLFMVARRRPLA